MMRCAVMMLCAAAMMGCSFKGGDALPQVGDGEVWRPEPSAARVYPSTRFLTQPDGTYLEARIELVDQMGDSIKGAGDFRLELHAMAAGHTAADEAGPRLYAWQVPLRTLQDQQRFYDAITRAYHFRLQMDDPAHATRDALLRVTFLPVTGHRLEAHAMVTPR